MSVIKDIETFAELTVERVNDLVKSHSRNWLMAFGLGVIILIVLFVVMFRKQKTDETLDLLKQQQYQLNQLTLEQREQAELDRQRDSVLYETYLKNSKQREAELSNAKKKSNESIDRIYQPDFNADSIKRWWADN